MRAAVSPVRVDGSEAMFTTMCALYAGGYEGEVNEDNWSAFRTEIKMRARQQQGPAMEAVREFYTQHQLRIPARCFHATSGLGWWRDQRRNSSQ